MPKRRNGPAARRPSWVAAIVLFTSVIPIAARAKELLVTGTAPNQVVVVDPESSSIVKSIALSGPGLAETISVDPRDSTKIYVITNQWQDVCKVDIKEGKALVCVSLSTPTEVVHSGTIEANPDRPELYVYEAPIIVKPGKYEVGQTRIRVLDTATLKTLRSFEVPRQGLVLAISPDGKTLYSFHVGDIYGYDPATGHVVKRIPWVHHNVTGVGMVDGLPFYPNYSENGHVVAFPYGAEDRFNGGIFMTGFAYFDLKTGSLKTFEIGPYGEEHYYLGAAISPTTGRGYLCWNYIAMVDVKSRKLVKQVMMDTTRFFPVMSGDGKKLYLPRGSGSTIAIYDATSLKRLKVIEIGSNMAAASLRVVRVSD
jgi:DNA-binding beta-propeller fold protein YncE